MKPLSLLALVLLPLAAPAQTPQGARYLIIAADEYCDALRPLADWKTAKGMPARIVPLSVAGTTPDAVREFVQAAWSTWPVRPDYLLLAACPAQLTGYGWPPDDDTRYGDMTGDYHMEVAVGRLPAWDVNECNALVAKCLAFENPAPGIDTSWYLKGTTCISEDSPPDQYYQTDSREARNLWLADGYLVAESLSNFQGSSSPDVDAAARDGRMFITFRGTAGGYWWVPFHYIQPASWNNGPKMPIVIGATCETITLAADETMYGDQFIRTGTVAGLGGAVAYFGTSMSDVSVSQPRSLCYRGFFNAVFNEHVPDLGTACLRAKIHMDSVMHDTDRYNEWCLLGDPDLPLWTDVPRATSVAHDTTLRLADSAFTVAVSSSGAPVSGAVVCVSMDSTVYRVDTTDGTGSAALRIHATHPGTLRVVVTGPNQRPYDGTCRVWCAGPVVLAARSAVSDPLPGGNADSCAAPGETVDLEVLFRNYGDSTAHGVFARLRSTDPYVTLIDTTAALGSVAPGDSATVSGFRFAVSSSCPPGHTLGFTLACSDSAGHDWSSQIGIVAGSFALRLVRSTILDTAGNANSILDPDESASYVFTLANDGFGTAAHVHAVLRSGSPGLIITDSLSDFGVIPGQSGRTDNGDCFGIAALHVVPETPVLCTLRLHAPAFDTAIPLDITVGRLGMLDPVPDGPRQPSLYYAYDNIDVFYAEHPTYSWVELRGTGTPLTLGDNQTVQLPLPDWFGPLAYYGQSYDSVSVCSNGWLAPGYTTYTSWTNRQLPAAGLPPLIAANWDDLYPTYGGGILYQFDSAAHRLVVEWDSVHYRSPSTDFDKFEVVIYDSSRYSDLGRNQFLLQYRTFRRPGSSTVGIQDPTATIGITDLFNGAYHRAAGTLGTGRCILFTTDHPAVGITEDRGLTPDAARPTLNVSPTICRVGSAIRVNSSLSTPFSLSLFSSSGRLLSSFVISTSSFVIPPLPSGLYFARLTAGGHTAVRKLVIEH